MISFQASPSGTAKASNAHHSIVHQYDLPGPARDRAAPSPPSAWAVATRDPQPASAHWNLPSEPSSTMRGTRKPSHGLSELLGQGNKALAAMNHLHITPTRIGAYLIVAAQPSRSTTSRQPASQQGCKCSRPQPRLDQKLPAQPKCGFCDRSRPRERSAALTVSTCSAAARVHRAQTPSAAEAAQPYRVVASLSQRFATPG